METTSKSGRYQVIFAGTAAEGDRRIEVMGDVMRILKLDERRVIALFERSGEGVLYRTDDRDRAERLVSRLRHAGARADLRDTQTVASKSWQSWELTDKPDPEFHAFHCNACNHALRLPLSQPLPAVCPECGVVAAKYHTVEQKKRRRERVRRKVMDLRKARDEEAAAAEEVAEEAALRKQIEREVRREVQRELGLGNRLRNGLAAGAIFAVGAGSAALLMQDPDGLPRTTAVADSGGPDTLQTATPPARAQQATLHIAKDLLRKLAVPTDDLEGGQIWTFSADAEPWLTLPPTAAGSATQTVPDRAPTESIAKPAGLLPYAVQDAELALMIGHWQNHASAVPLTRLRLQRLIRRLLMANQVHAATGAALLAEDPASRLGLLMPVIEQVADTADRQQQAYSVQTLRVTLAEYAGDDLALASWLLERTPAANELDTLRPQALPAQTSAQLSRLPQVERIALYAQLAAYLAERGAAVAAQTWFDAANTLLRRVTDPRAQLVALAQLARAYHRANDHRAATGLLARIGAALPALPGRPDARLLSQVLQTYAAIGRVDDAVAAIEGMGETTLDGALTQADLALSLSTAGHGIAARALVEQIADVAVRARTLAWLSATAREHGRIQAAAGLAVQARDTIAGLRRELVALVEGELAGPGDGRVTAATLPTGGDDYHSQLAMTLAWQQAFGAARNSAMAVRADLRRARLLRDLDTLQSAFAGLPAQLGALPQTSSG